MNLLEAGLEYADRGWPVFPCYSIENGRCSCGRNDCSAGKHPLTPAGFKDASTDPVLLKAWWTKHPNANIGIATGAASKTAVVDIDDECAWKVLHEMLPGYDFKSVARQKTGNGWHLAFGHPGIPIKSGVKFRPGMDSRGDGGYIMGAPSLHVSGKRYEWQYLPPVDKFPPLPTALITAINGTNGGNGTHHERMNVEELLKGVRKGEQRVTAFRLGCKFRRADIPLGLAEELILKFARACTPPLPEREALSQLNNAYRRYAPHEEDQKLNSLVEVMANIEVEEVDWLWSQRIARGKLNMFEGDPEIGKSYASLAIAAALSAGRALPFDREPEAPLRSLIISREDNPSDTIRPRLELLGADMHMIAIPHRDSRPSLDPNYIARVLDEWPAAYVVIDPVIALAAGKNTDRAGDVRSLLDPLVSIAARYNAAIVLIRHLNKSVGSKALYRGQGSIDFTAICRSVFTFAHDSETTGRRLMTHTKGSLSSKTRTLEYFLDDQGGFRWGSQSDETADDVLGAGEPRAKRESRELDAAKEFLQEVLAAGPMPSEKVKELAKNRGISNATLWRAKESAEVRAKKSGMSGEWLWQLP